MTPGSYVTPDQVQELDDALRIAGGLGGVLAALGGAWLGFRKWWHRRRNRQEQVLRAALAELRDSLRAEIAAQAAETTGRLDAIAADVTEARDGVKEIRESQLEHITDHAKGVFRTA